MKQYLYTIRIGVILLITTIFTACSNEDTATDNPFVANTYSLTINASKGEDDTRALSLDGTKLNATWTVDEAVTVYNNTKSAELSGTLKAKKAGSSTTLSGSLSGSIEVDDVLTLKFCSDNNYHSQGGTLDYIASHCDYATATVTVAAISGGNISIKESAASFKNQQAIVKFTLKDKADGTTALNATSLVVTVGSSTTYTVTPTATASDLFVAIPGISGENVTLSAKVGSDTYTYNKTGVTFENGKYYTIGVKMTRQANSADLGKVIAQNGCIYNDASAATKAGTVAAGMIAYVGNASPLRTRHGSEVDIAASPRSTGSILKPFLYCAALQDGTILPRTLLRDTPVNLNGFTPQNFDLQFHGAVPAAEALARSLNVPA